MSTAGDYNTAFILDPLLLDTIKHFKNNTRATNTSGDYSIYLSFDDALQLKAPLRQASAGLPEFSYINAVPTAAKDYQLELVPMAVNSLANNANAIVRDELDSLAHRISEYQSYYQSPQTYSWTVRGDNWANYHYWRYQDAQAQSPQVLEHMVSLKRDYARLMKKWSKYYRDAMTALANHNTTKFDPGPSQEDREILGAATLLNWDKLMFWLWELKAQRPNLYDKIAQKLASQLGHPDYTHVRFWNESTYPATLEFQSLAAQIVSVLAKADAEGCLDFQSSGCYWSPKEFVEPLLAYYETRRAEEMRECTTWVNDSEAVHKQEPFIDTLEGLAGRQVTLYTNGLHSAELAVKNISIVAAPP